MQTLRFGLMVAWLWMSPCVAKAQYFWSTYGYGAPLSVTYGYPGWGYPYPGYGYGGYPIRYGYSWPYYLDTGSGVLGPYVAPPIYVPPEQLGFGPQAVRNLLGLNAAQRPIVNRNIIVAPPAADKNVDNGDNVAQQPQRRVRASNAEARARSEQFLQFGDRQFATPNLAGAYDRYKKAADAAPDLAEPYFRLGHTLAAMGRYEQAAQSFARGLGLQPDWPTQGLQLAELYRDKVAARLATLDTAKRAAAAEPDNGTVQFVAGVQFFFDGQTDTARGYFESAKALGVSAAQVEPFLRLWGKADAGELDI